MNNFLTIYRILHYLEKAMDYDEPDLDRISAKTLGLTIQRRAAIMSMLSSAGYISEKSADSLRITLKGLEYLQENSLMKKAAVLAKGAPI